MSQTYLDHLKEAIRNVNLSGISVVSLTGLIREHNKTAGENVVYGHRFNLAQSVAIARALKEAHRLGEIRGQSVIKSK